MAKDIKELSKITYDMEKRLKFNEARIKALADAMTSSKDIEKYLDVLYNKMGRELSETEMVSRKLQDRQHEMSEKAYKAREKESRKEWERGNAAMQKEVDGYAKEAEKMAKDSVRKAEMTAMAARIANLEAQVKAALAK